jgi:hypothetical protein
MQFKRDSPVAIATFILNADLLYCIFLTTILFRLIQMLQVIVIAAPGEFGCYQELVQRVFLP